MSVYRKEWSCCGSVTETDGWEQQDCPICKAAPEVKAEPFCYAGYDADRYIKIGERFICDARKDSHFNIPLYLHPPGPADEPKLDSPAKVNGGIFGKGIPWKTVIEAAQRQYKWHMEEKAKPPKTPEQLKEDQLLLQHFLGNRSPVFLPDVVEQIRALEIGEDAWMSEEIGFNECKKRVLSIIEGAK